MGPAQIWTLHESAEAQPGSKDILNFCSLSLAQANRNTHAHTRHAADLSSPFLPEFGGPGGLSVTDPVKGEKTKNNTCTT